MKSLIVVHRWQFVVIFVITFITLCIIAGDFLMIQQENLANFSYTTSLLNEEKRYYKKTGGVAGHADEDRHHAQQRIRIFDKYVSDMHDIRFLGLFPPAFPKE